MNKMATVPRWIVQFRIIRPLLDVVVFLCALLLFIHLRSISSMQESKQLQRVQIGKLTAPLNSKKALTKSESLLLAEETHASEHDMWKAWVRWIESAKPDSGNCLFEPRWVSGSALFYMACFGNPSNAASLKWKADEPLFPSNLFVALVKEPETKTTSNTSTDENTKKTTQAHKVEGWMNTSSGRKYFDPKGQKWVP